MAKNGLT